MNEFDNFNEKTLQNMEYDYSNRLADVEYVSYLVQYMDSLYKDFLKRIEADAEKNKPFKPEYREYLYKKGYSDMFQIYMNGKSRNSVRCNDFLAFQDAVKMGYLKEVDVLEITMNLNFRRGKEGSLEDHENTFLVKFRPYEIKFVRKSNYKDPLMDQIEENILEIFNQFPVANTIFCDKS